MCGIAGILNKESSSIDKNLLKIMSRSLSHRGPDEEGYFINGSVGLGIQRLKVIDLKTGAQPVHNENRSIWVIFNGEIYNYQQLRNELEQKNHTFYTASDSETIVHSYEEWGEKFVEHLDGMFAIAIWDKNKHRLILARDRVGIKPLYYFETPNTLIFGSEIKALLNHYEVKRRIDFDALNYYLAIAYVPAPLTMFHDILKLPPGHMLICEHGSSRVNQYWDISYQINSTTEESCLEQLDALLKKSVKGQMVSDVPLGLFLSGGIDSSILACLMAEMNKSPVATFSISFEDERYDESKYARLVADYLHTEHHEYALRPNILEKLEEIIWHLDEPLADPAALPSILLARLAKEHVTVVLNGAGGDEIFGGYDRYRRQKFTDIYLKIPEKIRKGIKNVAGKIKPDTFAGFDTFAGRVRMITEGAELPLYKRYIKWASVMSTDCRNMILSNQLKQNNSENHDFPRVNTYMEHPDTDNVNKMMYTDIKTYLVDDILTMTDKMSMAHGLEVRVPLLDHEVIQFAATIPVHYKIRGGTSKYLLRKYLSKRLPKEVYNRPKQGFQVPVTTWFKKDKKSFEFARETLLCQRSLNRGIFNADGIEQMLTHHKNGNNDYGDAIWTLFNFELWCQRFLDTPKIYS